MNKSFTIAIDIMGGDHGAVVTVPAAVQFLQKYPSAKVLLVGQEEPIKAQLKLSAATLNERISVVPASEVVGMDESPTSAMKNKKDSSMRVALNCVKDGRADACVSAGNTGALMATARFVLKMLPGIDRPAIASSLPNKSGETLCLDLGANVDCTPLHLQQFALMGAALVSATTDNPNPRVGILNIGEEDMKGNELVKEASELIRASGLNFIGNVEGNDIYTGNTDVLVCDGFVGNVALKTSEGLAKMLGDFLKEGFGKNIFTKLAGLLAYPILAGFKKRIDPRRYNGATLIGLKGVVLKSHGSADALSFRTALEKAALEVEHDMLAKISANMAKLHSQI